MLLLVGSLVDELDAYHHEPQGKGETELTVGNAGGDSAARDRSEDTANCQLPQ